MPVNGYKVLLFSLLYQELEIHNESEKLSIVTSITNTPSYKAKILFFLQQHRPLCWHNYCSFYFLTNRNEKGLYN